MSWTCSWEVLWDSAMISVCHSSGSLALPFLSSWHFLLQSMKLRPQPGRWLRPSAWLLPGGVASVLQNEPQQVGNRHGRVFWKLDTQLLPAGDSNVCENIYTVRKRVLRFMMGFWNLCRGKSSTEGRWSTINSQGRSLRPTFTLKNNKNSNKGTWLLLRSNYKCWIMWS